MPFSPINHTPWGACWLQVGPPLPGECTPAGLFAALRNQPGCLFLDSSLPHARLGRYSYLAADPFAWVTCDPESDGFSLVEQRLAPFACETIPGLPPFQGGAAGCFGYELCHSLEKIPRPRHAGLPGPAMAVGMYDVVLAFDHQEQQLSIVSQGLPQLDPEKRSAHAVQRLQTLLQMLDGPTTSPPSGSPPVHDSSYDLPPQHPLAGWSRVTSDFSRDGYLSAVQRAVDYIHAGDVFQVNLTQRLMAPLRESPSDYYLRLREQSPAPFAGYFDAGEYVLCSASPERFLRVENDQVETRPIKGTRPRSADAATDAELAGQLAASTKDRAENTMIVDLLRNDLSRVCTDDSVAVPTLCGLESYEQVHHLVSVVEGRLRSGVSALDALRACFPGGSITGAPKVRAMEIISELESTPRGPYCGSLAYIGFNGAMDSSILIRTAVASHGWLQMSVGGGVVADSVPEDEYEETLQKAAGMLAALPRETR
ncbi:Aminodeoxychorismate synthase component 1 [Posidoniimonas corsicana]|uniref:aminodeoxychorismate synthase n=1 Tax=Posidoniimonas corsicana TaxID=1938618 RepID=A0A5C5VA50_9BACT|nr:aminodeoxychorismate synthase component I [Posidoniimonas corsicana]TWT35484.1 Aminodeoxychorismate synthase component 1 [Posidoniimonas corsicana]